MNSIYKQLDKIDDNKSLNEKWNVKNQRELKKLKEDVQHLNETNSLVKEIQEYIRDNIFGWESIGFENDHIYVVFDEETEDYTIDSCEEELGDEFGHTCELEFEIENETTLLIYVSISDEVDDENYERFVEHQVNYSLRAKDAQIRERDYGYEFLWISQEKLSQHDAYELAVATNTYLVHVNKVGKLVKGTCYCRSYPKDSYKVQFTVKEDLRFTEIEDATVYEYGIIDDSEYFEEEYTTDWDKALETFNNVAHRVQGRLVDMDDDEYEDYYSDGVVVRMIKGKEGSDAFDWDTIREVAVFRDYIENEEELEESVTLDENIIVESTRSELIKKIQNDLGGAKVNITTSDGNVHIHSYATGADYDILFDRDSEDSAKVVNSYSKVRFNGNGTIVNGDIIDNNGNNLGPAFFGKRSTSKRYNYVIRSSDVKMPQTYDQMIAGLKADIL